VLSDLKLGRGDRRLYRHSLETSLEGLRDTLRVSLCQLGPFAGKEIVDGAGPECEPPLEVPGSETDARVQRGVRTKGATAVGTSAEQDRLPEGRNLRHVRVEIELGHVDEDPADYWVDKRSAVKLTNETLAVPSILDIADLSRHPWAKGTADVRSRV
jgi:hypothetical protein